MASDKALIEPSKEMLAGNSARQTGQLGRGCIAFYKRAHAVQTTKIEVALLTQNRFAQPLKHGAVDRSRQECMKRKATNTNGIIGSQYPESLAVEGRIPTYKPVVTREMMYPNDFRCLSPGGAETHPFPQVPPKCPAPPFCFKILARNRKQRYQLGLSIL